MRFTLYSGLVLSNSSQAHSLSQCLAHSIFFLVGCLEFVFVFLALRQRLAQPVEVLRWLAPHELRVDVARVRVRLTLSVRAGRVIRLYVLSGGVALGQRLADAVSVSLRSR